MLISPFPETYRGSGLLLHVTSLPTPFGIGDLGPSARRWVDRLAEAGQSWWQMLPIGPTGSGNSPYQLVTSFGGNPLLISPELLRDQGLLTPEVVSRASASTAAVDYDAVRLLKQFFVEQAWAAFRDTGTDALEKEFGAFREEHQEWLEDFALFECLRITHKTGRFWLWPCELAQRQPDALQQARRQFADHIIEICFAQFLVFRQIAELKAYAHSRGVRLIGDLPFYVSPESSDVWANPELFLLDEQLRPTYVAGVPPDYFSETGQLWGNPVYDWDAIKLSGFDWWKRRIRALLLQFDVIRLDHFRGFAAAWHVPASAKSALEGEWRPGPGAEFFQIMQAELGGLPFLAEDLGEITPDVIQLRDEFQLTGMRVLQFAFNGRPDNPFLPGNFIHNTVAYTATHDNDTTRGWYQSLPARQRTYVRQFLKRRTLQEKDVAPRLIQAIWSSDAALAIAPLQDLLNLSSEHRMNTPGQSEGNWSWRCSDEMLEGSQLLWLKDLSVETHRAKPS